MPEHPLKINMLAILLLLVFAVVPSIYINRFLVKLIRPKESGWRFLAHIIILLAVCVLYTSLIVVVLTKYILPE